MNDYAVLTIDTKRGFDIFRYENCSIYISGGGNRDGTHNSNDTLFIDIIVAAILLWFIIQFEVVVYEVT